MNKKVTNGSSITETNYLAGYQYVNNELQFFPTAEGYVDAVKVGANTVFTYVYNYTDHLGSVRLSYAYDINNASLKIMEENNYYPFGLKMRGFNFSKTNINPPVQCATCPPVFVLSQDTNYKYKYNGKEFQEELGLNVTAMDFRQYDNALGRFGSIDKLSEYTYERTPYRFAFNNPILFNDPSGLFENNGINDEDPKPKPKPVYVVLPDVFVRSKRKHTLSFADSKPLYDKVNNISIEFQNWFYKNAVFEVTSTHSIGVQGGAKVGVADISAGIITSEIGTATLNFIPTNGRGKGKYLSYKFAEKAKAKNYLEGNIGIKKTKISLGGEVYYEADINENEADFIDAYFKENGKADADFKVGHKSTSYSTQTDCNCLQLGTGIKVLFGIDINLNVGWKK